METKEKNLEQDIESWSGVSGYMTYLPQGERLVKLNQIAIQQMQVLEGNNDRKLLK